MRSIGAGGKTSERGMRKNDRGNVHASTKRKWPERPLKGYKGKKGKGKSRRAGHKLISRGSSGSVSKGRPTLGVERTKLVVEMMNFVSERLKLAV